MTRLEVRGAVRLWLVPVVAVLAVLVLVAALGGFRSSGGSQGRPVSAGAEIDLARWQLVVHGVEILPDPYDPKAPAALRVSLRATATADRTLYGLEPGFVSVATPAGPLDVAEYASRKGSRSGDFDPDVPQEVTLDFAWPTAPAQPPPLVRVLVRDERQGTNYLFSQGEWNLTPTPVVHLDLPCPDRR